MTTRNRVTARNVQRAQAVAPAHGVQFGVDMRLTTDDLARLSPEQVRAVFEGVGQLAALGLGR